MDSNGVVKLQIQIPQQVYDELKTFIETTIAASLQQHIDKIQATPKKLTRKECAAVLKISLPTLDKILEEGKISSERAGKRILIDESSINQFLQSTRRS